MEKGIQDEKEGRAQTEKTQLDPLQGKEGSEAGIGLKHFKQK